MEIGDDIVRKPIVMLLALAAVVGLQAHNGAAADKLHVPKQGSAEQRGLLKALQGSPTHNYKVHFLKLHNGWAWADVTPLDAKGKPVAEGGPQLLHQKAGTWTVEDLSKVPDDPNDPMGAQDASAGFVKNLRKMHPEIPKDIFPKPSH